MKCLTFMIALVLVLPSMGVLADEQAVGFDDIEGPVVAHNVQDWLGPIEEDPVNGPTHEEVFEQLSLLIIETLPRPLVREIWIGGTIECLMIRTTPEWHTEVQKVLHKLRNTKIPPGNRAKVAVEVQVVDDAGNVVVPTMKAEMSQGPGGEIRLPTRWSAPDSYSVGVYVSPDAIRYRLYTTLTFDAMPRISKDLTYTPSGEAVEVAIEGKPGFRVRAVGTIIVAPEPAERPVVPLRVSYRLLAGEHADADQAFPAEQVLVDTSHLRTAEGRTAVLLSDGVPGLVPLDAVVTRDESGQLLLKIRDLSAGPGTAGKPVKMAAIQEGQKTAVMLPMPAGPVTLEVEVKQAE